MKKVLLILVAISFIACNDSKKEDKTSEGVQETKVEVELYTFDGGSVEAHNLNLFAQGETYKGESKKLADAFYVVKHPKGILLWDSGLPEGLVGNDPFTTPDGAFTISRKDSIVNQLSQIGLTPSDVDFIAFSHIHFDHTGTANNFSDATWLVQTPEYDFAMSEDIKGNGFYDPASFSELKKVEKLNGDKDVFGDGTVVIKSMPGHTPGHQVLYLELANAGPVLLSGDMYHFQENRDRAIVPQFNYDISQSEKAILDFEAFAKEKNATVYIQHEIVDFNKMPKIPNSLN
ncbi:N-acyl homoserine lactonase family protein [Ulvibacter antarcticus]|uniref:Metallo-beta-lactamase superfamily protein n=1 Tax=Ulvibacter antarcticus TaxID=442714 RepID=A0A3L9YYU0_9FLAO|nr:N-acyl homoserine lactonase family protein [Ulvibacter antarcticus]RMA65826.1 metallo-beta-lactamase superfamily protein [Ulvibacter antarcticus]